MFDITTYNEWIPIEVGIEERSEGELWYYNSINGNILLEKKAECYYVTFCIILA